MSTIARSWQRFHLFLDAPRPLNRLIRQGYKLAWGVAMVGIVALFYFNASRFTAHRSTDLSLLFDRLIPFVPWTWWMYFPGYLA
ncbi:MAG: hypothetical protein FJ125_05460, partial [Deltaproteobacteria bacterium]|nr:hypothetical protein [Deltaproteobacteria bacterium]